MCIFGVKVSHKVDEILSFPKVISYVQCRRDHSMVFSESRLGPFFIFINER